MAQSLDEYRDIYGEPLGNSGNYIVATSHNLFHLMHPEDLAKPVKFEDGVWVEADTKDESDGHYLGYMTRRGMRAAVIQLNYRPRLGVW